MHGRLAVNASLGGFFQHFTFFCLLKRVNLFHHKEKRPDP